MSHGDDDGTGVVPARALRVPRGAEGEQRPRVVRRQPRPLRGELLEPAMDFIVAFAPKLEKISPNFRADPRPSGGSLFRIYRHTRSKDKTPYKTNVGIHFRHELARTRMRPASTSTSARTRRSPARASGTRHRGRDAHSGGDRRRPERWRRVTRGGSAFARSASGSGATRSSAFRPGPTWSIPSRTTCDGRTSSARRSCARTRSSLLDSSTSTSASAAPLRRWCTSSATRSRCR